ncbi:BA75_01828T0 [Komagataella pastoris]|uniref:BA75_01828T0 n=1 Tax=Komagataella pastoris TaxID=4922 RepID=A0A1B2J6Q8_PICPA|nr:BA75_01828T0 [Komagataella pastoris]
MSSLSRNQIKERARTELSKLLPLDDESLDQVITYAFTLRTKEEIGEHFLNLLGESPDSFQFISNFQEMLFPGPRIEKQIPEVPSVARPAPKSSSTSPSPSPLQSKPSVLKSIKITSGKPSKIKTIRKVVTRPTSSPSSRLSSDSSNNPLQVQLQVQNSNDTQKTMKRTLNSLKDIDSAIAELEINEPVSLDGESRPVRRFCDCMAQRHPLFEMFPNCLNCGKIICIKEGLQPCSSCGKELLSNEEKSKIEEILNQEKLKLEEKAGIDSSSENTKAKQKKKLILSMNDKGKNNFLEKEMFFNQIDSQKKQQLQQAAEAQEEQKKLEQQKSELEYYAKIKDKSPELLQAQERLDQLLNFQESSAERTKIIDQASDFELPNQNFNLWASPVERALQLKKQQRQLRKQESTEKANIGRASHALNISIADGQVVMNQETIIEDPTDEIDQGIEDLEARVKKMKHEQLSSNVGKVWDPEEYKQKWKAPVYMHSVDDNSSETQPEPTEEWERVQNGSVEESEQILLSLPIM